MAQEANYKIPKAISPNNDEKEDVFLVTGDIEQIDKFSLKIMNRWGELIFETKHVTEGWLGKKNNVGKLLPQGTYIYLIKITDINGKEKTLQGNVFLMY